MPIRWDQIPHRTISLEIHARLEKNAAARASADASRRILRDRLAYLDASDHRRFVELEVSDLIEFLRCTRDAYRRFVEEHKCQPVLEAYWVILRCAVFPTAQAVLRRSVIEYVKSGQVPARNLSLLFGIRTHACYQEGLNLDKSVHGVVSVRSRLPDVNDAPPQHTASSNPSEN